MILATKTTVTIYSSVIRYHIPMTSHYDHVYDIVVNSMMSCCNPVIPWCTLWYQLSR